MPLIKSRTSLGVLVHAPYAGSVRGAVCLTCGRLVEYEGLVEGYPGETTWCKYLVKHHGAEELRHFDMESTNWDEHDLAMMVNRTNWFDPNSHEGLGLGLNVRNVGEHDDKDDDEFKIIVDGGK